MKVNQLRAGAVLAYISLFVGNIVSILYTPIMIRMLGPSEYGTLNLALSTVSYLNLFSFGIGTSYMKYNSKYRAKGDKEGEYKLNGMYFLIFSAISIIVFIAGLIISFNVNYLFQHSLTPSEISRIKILMVILTINTSTTFLMTVFISNIGAYERFVFLKSVGIISTVIQPLILVPLLYLGYKSVAITLVNVALGFITFIIQIVYCYKKLDFKMIFKDLDKDVLKDILIFSSFMFINTITDQINSATDKFLLGMYSGTVAVAIYNVGAQFNNYYLSFSMAISNIFTPRVNHMVSNNVDNKNINDLFVRIGRMQFIILALVYTGYIFFGQRFVDYLSGAGYESAYYIGLILLTSIMIPSIQNIGLEILKAKDLHKTRSLVYFLIALGNICISIPLCKRYEGIGCAIGTLIAMFIGTGIFMNIYYQKVVKINIVRFWKEMAGFLPSLIIPIVAGIFITKYTHSVNLLTYLLLIILYSIIYLICMYNWGMNDYEKSLFKEITGKFIVRRKVTQ